MRVIGGIVAWDPADDVSMTPLRAMTRALAGAPEPVVNAHGPVGRFSTLGAESLESGPHVLAVADLDLTNLPELQALTGQRGRPSRLVSELYALEGPEFVARLAGAFALALWDRRRRALLLAVDRFGIRRLYYATGAGRTVFASRPSALGLDAGVDPTAVYTYLSFGYVPAPACAFAGVTRVEPGHSLLIERGDVSARRYWDVVYREQPVRLAEGAATLERATEQAVRQALGGTTPKTVGAFLSGGTDSSTVVGLMTRISGEQVNAFSIGFREARYSELAYAELAARHFGAAHYTHVVTPDEALALLPRLVAAYDEPFGNSSAIGTAACGELARANGVTRLLAGDGGDEIFGGNERYRVDRIFDRYRRIPAILRRGFLEPVLLSLPAGAPGVLERARRYILRATLPNPRRFYSYEFFVAQHADRLLHPDFLAAVDREAPYAVLERHWRQARAGEELNRLLYLDLKLTIGDNDLFKVTRAAELASVGVRFPLLDPRLVEFTATLPASVKVRGLEKRYLFKRAFRRLLPREILAKTKHGFGVPTSEWLRSHPGFRALARETLLSPRARQRGYFRPGAVEELFERHAADTTAFFGDILWTLLMLELWHRRHADTGGDRA